MKVKEFFKKAGKKIAVGFMAGVMALTSLNITSLAVPTPGGNAFVIVDWYPYSYDFSGSDLGHSYYGQIVKLTCQDGTVAYCIRSSEEANDGTEYKATEDYASLNPTQKNNISRALTYGYQGSVRYDGMTADEERIATQIMIWNIVDGWYNNGSEDTALNVFTGGMPSAMASHVKDIYNKIKVQMNEHNTKPAYNGSKNHMSRQADGTYTVTLTDGNKVSSYFNWASAISGHPELKITSNTAGSLTLKSTKAIPNGITLTARKNKSKYLNSAPRKKGIYLTSPKGYQDVTQPTPDSALTASVTIYSDSANVVGNLTVSKSWTGGTPTQTDRSNASFTVLKKSSNGSTQVHASGSAGSYKYVATGGTTTFKLNASGTSFTISNLPAGIYIVTEKSSAPFCADETKNTTIFCISFRLYKVDK